ncbi:MAG: hypothetical protein HRU40_21020 [Saprospiraceae bacterium]|nr:hypothetical protein [Saprospiraceae bacterium]
MHCNKILNAASVFIMLSLMVGCSTSQNVIGSWKKDPLPEKTQSYKKVMIAAITDNASARAIIEADLATVATDNGYEAVKSIDVFPPEFKEKMEDSKEMILEKVRAMGVDAIFSVALLKEEAQERYVPGTGPYIPYPSYNWYGGFWRYYTRNMNVVYNAGYYTTDRKYYIEGNLYDAESEELLYSVQSVSYNPSDLERFSKKYAKLIHKAMVEEGFLEKEEK